MSSTEEVPKKVGPKCVQCEKTESFLWRPVENGAICFECYEQNCVAPKPDDADENSNGNGEEKKLRKSTRSTRYKAKTAANSKAIPKGRSRRNIFKKHTFKAPVIPNSTRTVQSLFYKDTYFQIGDIVSLMDKHDNVYYAQIRGLIIDSYCEKSAYLSWLIPSQLSPPPNERFDPSTYLIGPDEDSPRKLSCMEFIMHAPSNYYYDRTTPFPPPDSEDYSTNHAGFIWTRLKEVDMCDK